jgi:Tfp pilus assembly protein PilV
MHRIPSRTYPSRIARALRADDGFGLIEVMVSAVVVIVLALATLSLLDRSNQVAATSRDRAVAANLAHGALNTMRSLKFSTLSNYAPPAATQQVGGVNYTITSKAEWTTDNNAPLNCGSTGAASPYLRITSTVTWPNMGNVPPITASSLVSPRASDVEDGAGSLVVVVKNAASVGVPGVAVTAGGQSATTDAQGCVIFHFLAAGAVDVSWFKSGYVAPDGNTTGTMKGVSITNGKISTITPSYDVPAKINTQFAEDLGGSTPATSWYASTISTGGTFLATLPTLAGADAATLYNSGRVSGFQHANVYPVTAGYGAYAGTCSGNDPTAYVSDWATQRPAASVKPAPGGTATATAYLERGTFSVTGKAGTSGRLVLKPYTNASLSQMVACTKDTDEIVLPLTFGGSSGTTTTTQTFDLPYGVWQMCADNGVATGTNRRWSGFVNAPYGVIPKGTVVSTAVSNADKNASTQSVTINTSSTGGPCT